MSAPRPLPEAVGDVWLDGELRRGPEARLSVLTHSLHYGTAVFEGLRVYDGNAFLAVRHFQRLAASARTLGYTLPYSPETLAAALADLVRHNGLREGYGRAIAWLGDEKLGLMAEGLSVHVALAAWPWPRVHRAATDGGIAVWPSGRRRPTPETLPPQLKAAGGYLIGALAYREARERGFDDAILCDSEGRLAESTSANLFFVRDGTLCTPRPDGFLDGLTRQSVLALARALGLPCREAAFAPDALATASEAFLTGTAVEIVPITRIGARRLPRGPVTDRLAAAYAALARRADADPLAPEPADGVEPRREGV